jgi:hypothetical protein
MNEEARKELESNVLRLKLWYNLNRK